MRNLFTTLFALSFATSLALAQDEDFDSAQEDVQETVQEDVQEADTQEAVQEVPQETAQAESATNDQANVQNVTPAAPEDNYASEDYASTVNAKKPSRFGFGARVAFEYGSMYGFDDQEDEVDGSPSGIGFDIGVSIRVQLVDGFAFVPELNFATMETKHKYMGAERTYSRMDIELPLMLRGSIGEMFYISFGPQLNFNIGDESNISTQNEIAFKEEISQNSMDFGLAAGAGINIVQGLFADVRFYMGLTELFPDVKYLFDYPEAAGEKNVSSINMAGAKMMKIKVGIGYWFL